jgi:beta-lactamase regulating signal transducer with metallopeptidase domain
MTDHLLVTMSIRTLAIAGVSIFIGTLFRRAKPSSRSIVWNSALLACLIAPLASNIAPSITVFVPKRLLFAAAAPPTIERSQEQFRERSPAASHSAIDAKASQHADAVSRDRNVPTTAQILLFLWLAGVLFMAIRFGRQVLCARRLARRTTRVSHPRLTALLTDARSSLRIRREVEVRQSYDVDIPLVTGILSPVILLPASAGEWTEVELRIVLLHELAHVRRGDIAVRAVAMIACAIHWFNPLVWVIAGFSTRDAELAADELVLYAGVRPSTYADALLNLAGSVFHFPAVQPAMPLARRGGLADRVHAILRETHRRTDTGRFTRVALIGGSCSIALLAACVRFAPAVTTALTSAPRPSASTTNQMAASRAPLATISATSDSYHPAPTTRLAPRIPASVAFASAAAATDSSWIDGATDGLIRALADVSPQVRGGAAHSLGRLHAERARSALLALADDPDKYVRYEVDQALTALDRSN